MADEQENKNHIKKEEKEASDKKDESVHKHKETHKTPVSERTFEINLGFFIKNRVLFALLAITILSFYVRTFNFHYNYLLNVDSYFFYRYMKMIVQNGAVPAVDPYMLAPDGMEPGIFNQAYEYVGAYMYMFIRLFIPDLELWRFLVYLPALLASIMAIPAYYIGKLIYDRKAGIIMAFLVVFNPAIFMRSLGGDPDSDAMVMLAQLIAMSLFLFSYKEASNQEGGRMLSKKAVLLSILAGLSLTLFALTWVGYWYMFYLISGLVFGTIAIDILVKKAFKPTEILKITKPILVNYCLVMGVFFIVSTLFFGTGFIWMTLTEPFSSLKMKVESGYFPNVYVSVQEMMAGGSPSEIIQRAGTIFFFLTFVVCIPYLIGSYLTKRKHMDTMILIILWSFGALVATLTAVRFSILLAIPISLGSSIVLAKIWRLALCEDKDLFE